MSDGLRMPADDALLAEIMAYWDARVHDTRLSEDPPGSRGFFAAMAAYRYAKLGYLPGLVEFGRWQGRDVLDVGCGAGLDLVRLARGGARATGVELSRGSLSLACRYLEVEGLHAELVQADASRMPFREGTFDLVLCHGVLPFAPEPEAIVKESHRVLRDGGLAIFVDYNRHSLMNGLRTVSAVAQGHGDAPVFRTRTRREFDALVSPFAERKIRTARCGWHLVARCRRIRGPASGGG